MREIRLLVSPFATMPGKQDDLRLGPAQLDLPQGFDPVHSRHHDVQNDHVKMLLTQGMEGFLATPDAGDREPPAFQTLDQGFHEIPFVIDHKDRWPGMHGHDLRAILFCHDVSPARGW